MKNSSQLSSELFNHSNISVLAIQNYGPSGTLFLQSLVDNHPGNGCHFQLPCCSNEFFEEWKKCNECKHMEHRSMRPRPTEEFCK